MGRYPGATKRTNSYVAELLYLNGYGVEALHG